MVKFLIIRFSSIGDIILTTPVIRCLKTQVEGAYVHYATKKQFAPILDNNPYIERVHLFEGDLNSLVTELKNEEFDYIIDLHHNLRSYIVKSRIRTLSFSFRKLNIEKWLLVNFKINRLPRMHIVDRYLETLKMFDIRNDGKGLDYFISEKDKSGLAGLPEEFRERYIAFAIGGMHGTKKLPTGKIIQICERINLPVVLLGGDQDVEAAREIAVAVGRRVVNACGRLNINQSASLVKHATLVITHDTGLMHIASAFRKKIISVWGNTIPEFGMYPYYPDPDSEIVQVNHLSCRPCSKIGYSKCPKKHFRCIRDIDTGYITDLANKLTTR